MENLEKLINASSFQSDDHDRDGKFEFLSRYKRKRYDVGTQECAFAFAPRLPDAEVEVEYQDIAEQLRELKRQRGSSSGISQGTPGEKGLAKA